MIKFRPLKEELGLHSTQEGFHDFTTVSINEWFLDDPLVASHEGYHDNLLSSSSYGNVQMISAHVLKSRLESDLLLFFSEFTSKLYDESYKTHERAATYLSIKSLPSQHHSRILNILKEKEPYYTYFKDIASTIDCFIYSSFLQHVVVYNLIHYCFSSDILYRLSCANQLALINVKPDDSPDKRFEMLFNSLGRKKFNILLYEINKRIPDYNHSLRLPSNFDVQDEQAWENLDNDVSKRFQHGLLDRIVYDWIMHSDCRISIESYDSNAITKMRYCAQRLMQLLKNLSGNDQLFNDLIKPQDVLDFVYSPQKWKAYKAMQISIKNPIMVDFSKSTFFNDLPNPLGIWKDVPAFITTISDIKEVNDISWTIFYEENFKTISSTEISHDLFRKALLKRKELISQDIVLPIDVIVVGTEVNSVGDSKLTKDLLEINMIPCLPYHVSLEPILWYMGGDFYRWYRFLVAEPDCKHFMFFNSYETDHKIVSWLSDDEYDDYRKNGFIGIHMHGFILDYSPNIIYIKFIPAWYSNQFMIHIMSDDNKAGRISELEDKEVYDKLTSIILRAHKWIRWRWEYY